MILENVASGPTWGAKTTTESSAWDYIPFVEGQKTILTLYQYQSYYIHLVTIVEISCHCSCPGPDVGYLTRLLASTTYYCKKSDVSTGTTQDVWLQAWEQKFDASVSIDIKGIIKAAGEEGVKALGG